MKKIIVITRSSGYKEIKKQKLFFDKINNKEESRQYSPLNLACYYLQTILGDEEKDIKYLDWFNKSINLSEEKFTASKLRKKFIAGYYDNNHVEYYETKWTEIKPYVTFKLPDNENTEITLLLWDKIPSEYFDYSRIELIEAICKDCEIYKDVNNQNRLYIHDKEWKNDIEAEMIRESKVIEGAEINAQEANTIKQYFSYAATFRHVATNYNATIFDKIINFDFDSDPITTICKELDKMVCTHTFKQTKEKFSL